MKNKIEKFLQKNLAVLILLQVAITFSVCEYIIIPCLNLPSTFLFFFALILFCGVVKINWNLFKKFILIK